GEVMRDQDGVRLVGIKRAIALPADLDAFDRLAADRDVAWQREGLLLDDAVMGVQGGGVGDDGERGRGDECDHCCDISSSLYRELRVDSTFRVSLPIEVVVLNCCVTETNETPWASNSSTSLAKSANERVRRSTL